MLSDAMILYRPSPPARRIVLPLLLIATLFACSCRKGPESVLTKDSELSLTVKPAMQSTFVPGLWTSLSVHITSGTKKIEGRLSVSCEDESQRTVTSYRDITIAASSMLLHRLTFRPFFSDITVSFVPSDRKLDPIHHRIELNPVETPLAEHWKSPAIVMRCGKDLRNLGIAATNVNARVISVTPGDLPDQWYGLESVSTIVITPEALSRLDGVQEKALTEWITAGGRLVVQIHTGFATGYPRGLMSLLPARVAGMSTVPGRTFSAEETDRIIELAQFSHVTGTEIKWWNLPVAVEGAMGLGSVVLAGINLADPVFARKELRETLRKILQVRNNGTAMPSLNEREFRRYGRNMKAQTMPVRTVLVLLLCYLVLVGPLDYFVLKKVKRLHWTWFTFSAVSIGTTFALLYWVYRAKAGVFSATTMAALMLAADGAERTVSLTDVYSQKTLPYSFSTEKNAAIRPVGIEQSYGLGANLIKEMRYGIRTEPEFTVESYRIPIWTYLTLRTDELSRSDNTNLQFKTGEDVMLKGRRFGVTHSVVLNVPPSLRADQADEYAANALQGTGMPSSAFHSQEHEFLTAATSEYLQIMTRRDPRPDRLLVARLRSGYAPFSVFEHDPKTECITYVIQCRDTSGQTAGSINRE
jgi:hypothetical protein